MNIKILFLIIILIIKLINSYPIINVDKNIYLNNNVNATSVYLIWYDESYQLILQSDYINNDSDIIMIGEYIDEMDTTGWGRLNITISNPMTVVIEDIDQAYFAGFIESVLTGERIYQMYTNFAANEFNNNDHSPSPKLIDFITQQMEFVKTQVIENNGTSQYWYSAGLIMSQFDGIVNGYQNSPFNTLSEIELYLLTSAGDLETLVDLFPSSNLKNQRQQNNENRKPTFNDQLMDCSGLIRLLPDYSDVYFAHATWRYYYGMLRVYKFYKFEFQNIGTHSVSFSSSPGFLSSKDDFYLTGNKLAIMETTNNIFNTSLFQYTIPQSVLVWQRAMISNMLAINSSEWVNLFSKYNSGTYQNQWMVVDYKLFEQGKPLPSGTFYIAEQIPGYVETADMTNHLNENFFWSSYNIPYFENIYNISGYESLPEVAPVYPYSYENCPRAQIFKRNATQVNNIEDMKSLLQYNNYKSDPLSFGSPLNSISSRGDLLTTQYGNRTAVAFGAVDTKVTSFNQIQTLSCTAISGPSTNSGTLPPFSWSENPLFENITHIGVPNVFNFDWQEMGPK